MYVIRRCVQGTELLTDSGFMAKDTNTTVLKYTGFFISDAGPVHWEDFYSNQFGGAYDNGVIKFAGGDLHIKYELFEKYMLQDSSLFAIGLGLVLALMIVYFRSLLVTIAALFSICFSAVIAYFIYNIVFQMKFFPFMNVSAIVVLIGVGADDVFVLFDIFMQMKKEHPDYELDALLRKTFQHAIFSILVTSLTTSSAFYATLVSSITSIKCFGLFAGTCILVNLFLMVTWVPSIMVISHKMSTCINMNCGKKDKCFSCSKRVNEVLMIIAGFPRKLFTQWMPVAVVKLRFLWLVLFGLLGVGGLVAIFAVPGLKPPTSEVFVLLRQHHPFERYDQVIRNEFRFEEESYPMSLYFVWGIEDVDNGNHLNPDDLGHITFHPSSNFFSDDYLSWMVEFCSDLIQSPIYGDVKTKTCFSNFQKILMDSCHLIENMTCCDRDLYNDNSSHITTCFSELPFFILGSVMNNFDPLGALLIDTEGRSQAYVIRITSTRSYTNSYALMDSFYQNVSTFFQEQMNSAPEFARSGWFAARGFEFYDLQRSLFSSFVFASGISLLLAAVFMLVTSRNLLITLFAIISILFALSVTVGSLVLAGWTLNILESVVFTLAVGLSIDFPIHYGVAYRQSHLETRVEKVNDAFTRVGLPVALAAFSTFLVGAVMLASQIMVYYQLGLFLVVVMVISWAYGTFFFLSLCACFGPLKNSCLITMPGKNKSHKIDHSTKETPSTFTNFGLNYMRDDTTKNNAENSEKESGIGNEHVYIVKSSDVDNGGTDNPGISRVGLSVPRKHPVTTDKGVI